jgi:hypothetical protein
MLKVFFSILFVHFLTADGYWGTLNPGHNADTSKPQSPYYSIPRQEEVKQQENIHIARAVDAYAGKGFNRGTLENIAKNAFNLHPHKGMESRMADVHNALKSYESQQAKNLGSPTNLAQTKSGQPVSRPPNRNPAGAVISIGGGQ